MRLSFEKTVVEFMQSKMRLSFEKTVVEFMQSKMRLSFEKTVVEFMCNFTDKRLDNIICNI